jgi:hypothetical protein
MGQVYQCWWGICQEIDFFCSFEYHMFYVLYPFVTYLLTLPSRMVQCYLGGGATMAFQPISGGLIFLKQCA